MTRMINNTAMRFIVLSLFTALLSCNNQRQSINVAIDSNSQLVQHGIQKLNELEESGSFIFNEGKPDLSIVGIIDTSLVAEAYRVTTKNQEDVGTPNTGLVIPLRRK